MTAGARSEEVGLARSLVAAERALRAQGLTGAQAFDALVAGLLDRIDDIEAPPSVPALAEIPLHGLHPGALGLAYERFFPDLFKGRHGQYFTPPAIVRLLLAPLELKAGDRVLDPACGAGGLLVAAAAQGALVKGIERDPRLASLSRLVLRLANVQGEVVQADMFAEDLPLVDVVVANPPFSIAVDDPEVLDRWGLDRATRSDALFVRLLARCLRPGGRAAVVMPWSLLVNPNCADLRDQLDEDFVRTGVCALPEGVFRPFGGAAGRACILWLRRRPTDPAPCRWSVVEDPGYDPRSIALKPTSEAEVDERIEGRGWTALDPGAWTPPVERLAGRRISDICTLRSERVSPGSTGWRLDLADVDRVSGETRPVMDQAASARQRIEAGDVLVSRLRPTLGNVAVARGPVLMGSPEWVVLKDCPAPHYLWMVLRSEAWRAQLPTTGGQTHPRTNAESVLSTRVPWPDGLVERTDAMLRNMVDERARLAERLTRLERAVARFTDDGDSDALAQVLDALDDGSD